MAFLRNILQLFLKRRRLSERRRFYLQGREITEAEWYINGGLEAEENLTKAEKAVQEFRAKYRL